MNARRLLTRLSECEKGMGQPFGRVGTMSSILQAKMSP